MHLTLVLTHDCNLACTYCYTGEKYRLAMDWDIAQRAVDFAFTGQGDVEIGFFGGEPLMAFDMLLRVCEYAQGRSRTEGRRVRFALTTNGTLLTAERAHTLAALGVEVTLSLDGVREAHEATRPRRTGRSSFDATLRAAQRILEAGMPLEVIAVVATGNVRYLGQSVRFLADLGARQITLNPCFEEAWSDEQLALWEQGLIDAAAVYAERMRAGRPLAMPTFDNKLLAAAKGGLAACDGCSAGERELAVAPSGNLYGCARMVGEDRDDALVIGHLDTGVVPALVRARLPRGQNDPACDACAERWRCGAYCACANRAETGRTDTPGGTQCWYEQATARVADAVGAALLDEHCQAFIAWIYGRVAAAAAEVERARARRVQHASTHVPRVRRLPVVTA